MAGVGRAGRASRPPEGASRPSVPPSLPRSAAGRGVRRRGAAALGEAERLKWRHRRDGGGGGRGGPGERARGRGWGGSTGEPGGAQPPGPVCGSGARRSLRPRTLWGPGRGRPTPALPQRCFASPPAPRGIAQLRKAWPLYALLLLFSLEERFNLLRVVS